MPRKRPSMDEVFRKGREANANDPGELELIDAIERVSILVPQGAVIDGDTLKELMAVEVAPILQARANPQPQGGPTASQWRNGARHGARSRGGVDRRPLRSNDV
jgi:hypothetical protein